LDCIQANSFLAILCSNALQLNTEGFGPIGEQIMPVHYRLQMVTETVTTKQGRASKSSTLLLPRICVAWGGSAGSTCGEVMTSIQLHYGIEVDIKPYQRPAHEKLNGQLRNSIADHLRPSTVLARVSPIPLNS
jgi:hypothetical protein